MNIAAGDTSRALGFVAVDATDLKTREAGLAGSNFTVIYARDGATDTAMTSPTITEVDASTATGVYWVDVDEGGMVTAAGDECETMVHITHSSMAPVTRSFVVKANTAKDLSDRTPAALSGGRMAADTQAISGDTTAADNAELMFDGTGYTDPTAPASRSQVGALSSGSGGVSTTAESFAKVGAEPETNTYTSTFAEDGTHHIVEDDSTSTDVYYQFDITGAGSPQSVEWDGYAQSNNDSYAVYAYDWGNTAWQQVGSISGTTGTTEMREQWVLTTAHVGTGANVGKVRLRFLSSDGTAIATDRILCTYAVVVQTTGYANGEIWVDTNVSNTTTENYVDGVADNPVSTWAAALTLSSQLGIKHFAIANGSTITLSANSDNYTLDGSGWTLALGGQSASGASFKGATVSGTCTGATKPEFRDCSFGATTLPPANLWYCGLSGTLTMGSAGTFSLEGCSSMVAGSGTPVIDFGSGLNSSALNMRQYSGGIEIQNMGTGTGSYTMSLEGWGQLVINANCSATSTVAIRGTFTVTDNASAAVTLSEDARVDAAQILGAITDDDTQFSGADIAAILADTGTDGVVLADGAITAAKIASAAITAAKIATDAITAAKIAADAIGASELATDAFDADALAADAIAEIVDAWFAKKPSDYEGTLGKETLAWILGLLGQCHKWTLTDDTDNTATLKLYKADGSTQWGGDAGVTTAASGDVITGGEDSAT